MDRLTDGGRSWSDDPGPSASTFGLASNFCVWGKPLFFAWLYVCCSGHNFRLSSKSAFFGFHRCSTPIMPPTPKNIICLWYDKDAEEAANFYSKVFPDSFVKGVHKAPGDFPGGKEGQVLTVEFTVVGIPCVGINGGPVFEHNESFSFQIATDDQEETDRYWNAILENQGVASACGWLKDKWGISWQITPRVLTDGMAAGGDEAKRTFEAMMTMGKIDVAAIEAARRG